MRIFSAHRSITLPALVLLLLATALASLLLAQDEPQRTSPTAQQAAQGSQGVILGTVVALADGDTVTVLDGTRRQHRIRLSGIDAPEQGQPGGRASQQSLSELVFGQPVQVAWNKRDRYGRVLGIVYVAPPDADCRGKPQCAATMDAGLEQIKRGHAWWYKHFASDQSAEQRDRYPKAEALARQQRLGLWRDLAAQPPWEYRRQNAQRARTR